MGVEWRDDYELHYSTTYGDQKTKASTDVTVYFPLLREAFRKPFAFAPGLNDRASPDFDGRAKAIGKGQSQQQGYFCILPKEIKFNGRGGADIEGIVSRLLESGGLRRVFEPVELPAIRWENVQLDPLTLPSDVSWYFDALRQEYSHGFVQARAYCIEAGELASSVFRFKRWWHTPVMQLELLRHPRIRADFEFAEMDEKMLMSRANWRYYSPFLAAGFLAETLAVGGAYSRSDRDPIPSVHRAELAFAELNRNYRNFEFHASHAMWCKKLGGLIDHTWLIFDEEIRRLIVLFAMDSD